MQVKSIRRRWTGVHWMENPLDTGCARIPVRTTIETYALDQANEALVDLKHQPVRGAKVLVIG